MMTRGMDSSKDTSSDRSQATSMCCIRRRNRRGASLSMAELVEISPFTSLNGEDIEVSVGREETSPLLFLGLETGKIRATLNAE